jgi:hypothetical protein
MALEPIPGFELSPSSSQVPLKRNYINNFDFLDQYMPDIKEEEFERYGNRSVASFLRMVSAELPLESDLMKWTEQGRLHTKYTNCTSGAAAGADTATITVNDTITGNIAVRVGQTISMHHNGGTGTNKAIVTAVNLSAGTFDVAYYEAGGQAFAQDEAVTMFIYGSEFKKGTTGMEGSLEADPLIFENSPIILKDNYEISGSDMAQIGWVKVETDQGPGYLWYLKSKSETRMRFDDYLETSMIETVPAETGSGAIATTGNVGNKGSEGLFYVVSNRGNVWSGGHPTTLANWDSVIARLDKQGAIEENAIFLNRAFGFDIDDMLATMNSYGTGGTSYGLFDNDEQMALNLGFTGFRRGYDFYKTDWKYLNDPTMRGDLAVGGIDGLLAPVGTTSVYDEIMGKNVKRPFLHVRYRKSSTEDRRYKTWITGGAGGAETDDLDAMKVNFLSERAICTLGANNFFIFEQ